MGVTNFGNQTISFDFQEPGKSENFNKLNHRILEPGIYEGGLLSYDDATHINVAPFLAYIEDIDSEVSVRVETSEIVNLLVASSAPYCILRFNWANITNNYVDILMTSVIDIEDDDLILGRVIYDVTTLETFFDYSKKPIPVITTDINQKSKFKVLPQEPYDKTVSILGGTFNSGVESIEIATSNSPTISDTILGRNDIVYITSTGTIEVTEGIDSGSPETPDYGIGYVLCEIHRGANKTYITGADIIMVTEDKFAMDDLLRVEVTNIDDGAGTGTFITRTITASTYVSDTIQIITDDMRTGDGIQDDAILSRHISDDAVLLQHINADATTSVKGISQLSDSADETSSVKAATPTAVKTVNTKVTTLEGKVGQSLNTTDSPVFNGVFYHENSPNKKDLWNVFSAYLPNTGDQCMISGLMKYSITLDYEKLRCSFCKRVNSGLLEFRGIIENSSFYGAGNLSITDTNTANMSYVSVCGTGRF